MILSEARPERFSDLATGASFRWRGAAWTKAGASMAESARGEPMTFRSDAIVIPLSADELRESLGWFDMAVAAEV